MKSTGEVMGLDDDLAGAFAKAQIAAGNNLPIEGNAFVSIKDEDKPKIIDLCRKLIQLDFNIIATRGTHDFLTKNSINSKVVKKVKEGHPNIVDLIKDNEIDIVMNTTLTKMEVTESFSIRRTALTRQVPYFTTVAGAFAAVEAIEYLKNDSIRVKPLQEYF